QVGERLAALGEPAFRARQVLGWVYRRGATGYSAMTDLPLGLRERLERELPVRRLVPAASTDSGDGRTEKVLFKLADGRMVEAVLMEYLDPEGETLGRRTVCVSSQAGCAYACVFCATGQQGYDRNLTAGEIVEQVLHFEVALRQRGEVGPGPDGRGVTNIVFMGMGEPLANYKNVWAAVERLHDREAFGMGARHLTISTVGLAPEIRRLAHEDLKVGLAISLHAADDELRDVLVPSNRRYPLKEVMAACREYADAAGRRITFEYVLLDGINDAPHQARQLARLVSGLLCHVNLIPVNPTPAADFKRPSRERMLAFQHELTLWGIPTTLRDTKGVDIAAGCGQLATREAKKRPVSVLQMAPLAGE
ncbi:MAG: 23S rRNA (adenine(2503)-C(2))-methyltransferase RlmN, partial [Chloroflexi bacterium]|nr:23S rRNA (adenine(2503)-C(2))-methyltransferase RlmN [Chloroflexota bacterium]